MWVLCARVLVTAALVAGAYFVPLIHTAHPNGEAIAFAVVLAAALLPVLRDEDDDSNFASDAGRVFCVVLATSSVRHARGQFALYALFSSYAWSWLLYVAADVGYRETAAMDAHPLIGIALSSEPRFAFFCLLFHPAVFGFAAGAEMQYVLLVAIVPLFVVSLRPPGAVVDALPIPVFVCLAAAGTIFGISYRSIWNQPVAEWVLSVRGCALILLTLLIVVRVDPV